jgi:hypothetical protein
MQPFTVCRSGVIVALLFPFILLAVNSENCHGFIVARNKYSTCDISSKKLVLRQPCRKSHNRNIAILSTDNPNQDVQNQLESLATKESFWNSQKELATALSAQTKLSLRQEQAAKFEKRRLALLVDTAYITWFIFCTCWMLFPNPMTAISYSFGATMGIAYTYGLGKSVEVIGQSIDDVGATQGAGVGEARYAFLILLFLFVGKFRGGDYGLQEIPSIAGFFTYQVASLNQGLREIND